MIRLRFFVFPGTGDNRTRQFRVESILPRTPFLESSLRRAMSRALQHPKVSAPRTNDLSVLVGHNP